MKPYSWSEDKQSGMQAEILKCLETTNNLFQDQPASEQIKLFIEDAVHEKISRTYFEFDLEMLDKSLIRR